MKKVVLLLFALTISIAFFQIKPRCLSRISPTWGERGDEFNYIKGSIYYHELRSKKNIHWATSFAFTSLDIPMTIICAAEILLYSQYDRQYLVNILERQSWWDHALHPKENIKRKAYAPRDILRTVRFFSCVVGIFSCIILFVTLWQLKIPIAALVASFCFINTRIFQVYSSLFVPEIVLVFFIALSTLLFMKFIQHFFAKQFSIALVSLFALCLSLALLTKLTALMYAIFFFAYLGIVLLCRVDFTPYYKVKVLCVFLLLFIGIAAILFYLLHPYIQLHPITGYMDLVKSRLNEMIGQGRTVDGITIREKIGWIPLAIASYSVPIIITSKMQYLIVLCVQNVFLFIGLGYGLKGIKTMHLDWLKSVYFMVFSLFIFMVILLFGFLHCKYDRYFLVYTYYYYIVIGMGVGALEKMIFRKFVHKL